MRKDINGSVFQFFQTQNRRFYSGSITTQPQDYNSPFQDDHIINQDDSSINQGLHNIFQNARKELLFTDQNLRQKPHSLEKSERQILLQKVIQSQQKQTKQCAKQQQSQINTINGEQQGQEDKMVIGVITKKLKIHQGSLHEQKMLKQEQVRKQDAQPQIEIKEKAPNEELIEKKLIETESLKSNNLLNESSHSIKTPEQQYQVCENQINIFENSLLKQILKDGKDESSSKNQIFAQSPSNKMSEPTPKTKPKYSSPYKQRYSSQYSKQNEITPQSKQKEQIPLSRQKDQCTFTQLHKEASEISSSSSTSKPIQEEQKRVSQIYKKSINQSQKSKSQCTIVLQKATEENPLSGKKLVDDFEYQQSNLLKSGTRLQHLNYFQYAYTQMQKIKMEGNIEHAIFTPVDFTSKLQQSQQKSISVNKILYSERERNLKDVSSEAYLKEDLNESILSNISGRLLPKNGECGQFKDTNNQNDSCSNSKSVQRSQTECSLTGIKNKEILLKKILPKLQQKQQQQYKFVKISQKSFGDESSDLQTASINSERRTPSLTTFRESPIQRKRIHQSIDKENSSNSKLQSSKSLKDQVKQGNKLNTICIQKNSFNKLLKDQLNHFEEVTNKIQLHSYASKVYNFSQPKNMLLSSILDLTSTLQKQEKKYQTLNDTNY